MELPVVVLVVFVPDGLGSVVLVVGFGSTGFVVLLVYPDCVVELPVEFVGIVEFVTGFGVVPPSVLVEFEIGCIT